MSRFQITAQTNNGGHEKQLAEFLPSKHSELRPREFSSATVLVREVNAQHTSATVPPVINGTEQIVCFHSPAGRSEILATAFGRSTGQK